MLGRLGFSRPLLYILRAAPPIRAFEYETQLDPRERMLVSPAVHVVREEMEAAGSARGDTLAVTWGSFRYPSFLRLLAGARLDG